MVSRRMSRMEAAAGRKVAVEGRKGGRWRQRRTERGDEVSKRCLQSDGSSTMIRIVVRLSRP